MSSWSLSRNSLRALAAATLASGLDVKVSKAMGSRGYEKVRISVVDDGSTDYGSFFDYNAPFAQTWSHLHLHSAIKDIPTGAATFDIAGTQLDVKLPRQGSHARGFFIADPCFSSRDMFCPYAQGFKVLDRLADVINKVVGSDDVDFWGILGDNFYESKSPIGDAFFARLNMTVKSKPFISVPGNHDFWIVGGPPGSGYDQFGYGFMQYYGQDTQAGMRSSVPYDFSVARAPHLLPIAENFLVSHQIGDLAFFGYSGAHPWKTLQPYAAEFCRWMENASSVTTALVLGHWNDDNLGCSDTSVPNVWSHMKSLPGCSSKLMLYVDGHEHCNKVTEPDHGFMIGANGMGGCGQFGFMILESNDDPVKPVRVDYFEINNQSHDYWDDVWGCLSTNGYIGCRDSHAQGWRRAPPPPTPPPTPSPAPSPIPTPSPSPSPSPGTPSSGLTGGQIALIVIAVLLVAAAGGGALVVRRRGRVVAATGADVSLRDNREAH